MWLVFGFGADVVGGWARGAGVGVLADGRKGLGCNGWTGGIVERLLASMHSVASPNLGTLLIGFLHIFGWAIDFTQVRLVTKVRGWSGGACGEACLDEWDLWVDRVVDVVYAGVIVLFEMGRCFGDGGE